MKKTILTLLLPAMLMAYQPASPPHVPLTAPPSLRPEPQMAIVPAVIIGAVVVGGVAWAGLKVANKVMELWEHRITNGVPGEVVFMLSEEYPE